MLSRYQNFSIRYRYKWKSTVLCTNFHTKAKHKTMLVKKHTIFIKSRQTKIKSLSDFKAKRFSLLMSILIFELYLWTMLYLNACMRNNQSSGCRPKCCYNQSDFFFTHDHGRVLERCCTSLNRAEPSRTTQWKSAIRELNSKSSETVLLILWH